MQPLEQNEFREAIKAAHGCDSRFVESAPVREVFKGETVWQGIVDTFDLIGHAKAKRCFAWRYRDGAKWRYTAVLEIPPVHSPETAVMVAIAAQSRAK